MNHCFDIHSMCGQSGNKQQDAHHKFSAVGQSDCYLTL